MGGRDRPSCRGGPEAQLRGGLRCGWRQPRHGGRARLWEQDYAADNGKVEHLTRGLAYIRPEDIELVGRREADTVPARVVQLTLLGPIARAELEMHGQAERVGVQLSRGRAAELQLRPGAEVFMRARQVRVFRIGEAEAA
jgi:sulfate/thiosulfate transport system ATP-binding protein